MALAKKADMTLGTNYLYHQVDFQGTDIAINITGSTGTLDSSTTDFTASTTVSGIVKRPIDIGDIISIWKTANNANEGFTAEVTAAPTANQVVFTVLTKTPVSEAAGSDINISAFKKQFQFLEAGAYNHTDGVDGIDWVSQMVDDWDVGDLDIYDPTYTGIEPRAKAIALLNGWEPFDSVTLKAIKNTAIEIRSSKSASPTKIYNLPFSDALHATTDLFTIWFDGDDEMSAPTNAVNTGYINENVLILDRSVAPAGIEAATQANPVSIQSTGHGLSTGDTINFEGVEGMTELNGLQSKITMIDANNFTLDGVDGSAFTAYTSGGGIILDKRGLWNFRCLMPGKTHIQVQFDLQYSEQTKIPSNNGIDPKLADGAAVQYVSDSTVVAGGDYANVLNYVDADELYDGDVNGSLESFRGYVDTDGQLYQIVHTKEHYLLRQPTNINSDGTGSDIRGDKHPPITTYLGEQITFDNYYPLNFNAAERNNLQVTNGAGTDLSWPKTLTLIEEMDDAAWTGTFTLTHKNTFGTSSPVFLQDESSTAQRDITITGNTQIVINFSTYNVDGHTPGQPIPLVMSYNRPGFIEPGNIDVTLTGANQRLTPPITLNTGYVKI